MTSTRIHFVALSLCLVAVSALAHADEPGPLEDLQGREPVVSDLAPRPVVPLAPDPAASLSLALSTRQGSTASGGTRHDYAGSVVLSLPTDLFWSARKAKHEPHDADVGGRSPPPGRAHPRSDPPMVVPLVRPRDARAASAAAMRAAGHDALSASLDDMASRARWSALLPQLRLRATRLVDESTSLSPTSYDADRTTSRGGASLWLEARTTWSLDRLVYANDEVRIERIQRQVADDARELRAHVLDQLFRWQRAMLRMRDPALSYPQCIELWLDAAEFAVALDVLTGGWFSKWRAERGVVPVACDDWSDTAGAPLHDDDGELRDAPEREP